ncbi:MAG: hypothetical protein MJK04_16220 [Psychrosphaera sp.]|nr:hypothetical protein [Psychrosphaera sp.]
MPRLNGNDYMDAFATVPAQPYKLTDEERLAMVDIVRYGDINRVPAGFRNRLLVSFAEAVVLALYGLDNRPVPGDVEENEMPDDAPINCDVLVQFTKLLPLPNPVDSD